MNCDARRDLMPEYTLGLLDEAEASALRGHLATGCPACAAALAEAEAMLAQLPHALMPVAPAPATRARLLGRIAREPRDEQSTPVSAPASASSSGTVLAFPRWLLPVAWAASLLLAVGGALALTGAQHQRQMQDLQQRIDSLARVERDYAASRAQVDQLTADAKRLGGQLASATETIGMLRAEKFKLVELVAKGQQPTVARARALWDQDAQHWQLIVTGMKPAGAGRTYELWFVTADQRKVAAGVFDVDQQGNAIHTVPVPRDIGVIAVAAVTDEPGMMTAPTGQFQLLGSL